MHKLRLAKQYMINEIRDYSKIWLLLIKGKGSLSDYLFLYTEISIGLLAGYAIWG